jgi:hypothetical protein
LDSKNTEDLKKEFISKYLATARKRIKRANKERFLKKLKKSYVPRPCDICDKPLSYEESLQMHMLCSVNPKNRFCGETVFCCDSHSGQERFDFVMNRRKNR